MSSRDDVSVTRRRSSSRDEISTRKKAARKPPEQRSISGQFQPGNSFAWRPGVSGNLSGRPRVSGFVREALREELQAAAPCSKCRGTGKRGRGKCRACHGAGVAIGTSAARRIARVLTQKALGGSLTAIGMVITHVEGPLPLPVDLDVHGDPKVDVRTLHMLIERSERKQREREREQKERERYDA